MSGNHVGASGKYFTEAINTWVDTLSLEYLNLDNCSIPKVKWCEMLESLRNLIGHQRLPKLNKVILSENQLHVMEAEVGKLLNTCLTEHQAELTVFLDDNGFSTGFVDHWKEVCVGTHLKPVFEEITTMVTETILDSLGREIQLLEIESIFSQESSLSVEVSHHVARAISKEHSEILLLVLFKCSALRILNFESVSLGNKLRAIIKAIHTWGPEPALQELSLTDSNIPEALCGPLLKALSSCKYLTHLGLSGNRIGIHGFHLAETINTWGTNPMLKTLDLTDCSLPSAVCGHLLSALARCRNLTDIWLPGNTLGGCMRHFLSDPSKLLPSLQELFLSYTQLNKHDLVHLARLIQSKNMPQLGELDLGGNNLHKEEDTIVNLIQALVTHHQRSLKLNLWFNYLSASLQERLESICRNTEIKLDF